MHREPEFTEIGENLGFAADFAEFRTAIGEFDAVHVGAPLIVKRAILASPVDHPEAGFVKSHDVSVRHGIDVNGTVARYRGG